MRSYFFVPGTKLKNINLIVQQGVDNIIVDLEEAIKGSERAGILDKLLKYPGIKDFWVRVPLRERFDQKIDDEVIKLLLDKGFNKFILPKLLSAEEFQFIVSNNSLNSDSQFIVLVEHPKLLNNLGKLLSCSSLIKGVGLGSHDLLSIIGGRHNLKNLEYPRQKLLYEAKAAGVICVDIASMELSDNPSFSQELLDGFEKGFDAKFLIHPWQLKIFNNFAFFSEEEFKWAERVLEAYSKARESIEFSPVVINNEVIERPHVKRAELIIEKFNKNERK